MRVRIPGDFSVSTAFVLATGLLLAVSSLASPDEPGSVIAAHILLIPYGGAALLSLVAAYRGRRMPDNATYFWWGDAGRDWFAVVGGAALLYFGGMAIVSSVTMTGNLGPRLFMLLFGVGFLWLVYTFLLRVRMVAFLSDAVLVFSGKPNVVAPRRYRYADFTSLDVRIDKAYAGTLGMVTTWQRQFDVYAVSGTGIAVHIGRSTTEQEARKNVLELEQRTGLSAGTFPAVQGDDQTRSISP